MTRFHTSDTHFGHARIIELCDRPFTDFYHMDKVLVDNWNDVVGPDDEVVHHGDVALGPWGRWDSILTRLNGFKTLVIGNHDRVFAANKPAHIERFYEEYYKWFDVIVDNVTGWPIEVEPGRYKFVNLSHFPYDGDSHGEDRYEEYRLEDKGVPLVHGHTHGKEKASVSSKGTPQFHVGVDAWDYRPVPESEIAAWLKSLA